MKLKVFTVYDSKVMAHMRPFFVQASGEAIRGFTELANDPNTNLCKYPGDFTLFEIGEFDCDTGLIMPSEHKHNWGTALEHKTPLQSPVKPAAFQQPESSQLAQVLNA